MAGKVPGIAQNKAMQVLAQKLLATGMTIEQVSEITGLPVLQLNAE